jgi:hypothetical protein
MKRILKILAIVIAVAFIAAQFFRPDRTNPQVVEADTLEAAAQVPESVKTILARSCADCHSNNTIYPWYSNISPVSWFLVDHIEEGRRELNLSEWNTYNTRKKAKKLEEICAEVQAGGMPLPSYLWIHWGAALSADEIKTLCDWTAKAQAELSAAQ